MKRVIVVGGGLAGMIAAREIAKRGHDVLILESSTRLGGKAGADIKDGRPVDHGYHVFPKWYPNVRKLVDEIGTKLVDFDQYHYLLPGKFPAVVTVRGPKDIASIVHNTFHGLLPWYQTMLFFAFTLDMMSRPLSDKKLLDKVSQIGLMRQAWYITEEVAEMNEENLLKASAIPAYEMSAMTAKRIGSYWLKQPHPFLSVLPGDLQSKFIEPIAKLVRDDGVKVELEKTVTRVHVEKGRVKSVEVQGESAPREADLFILATPFEVTRTFIEGPLFKLDPALGNLHLLEAQPMAALSVRLKKKIGEIPPEHVFFHNGAYGLSFIDVSQTWENQPDPRLPCLEFIASNYAPLKSLNDKDATAALLEEIMQYLPIKHADIDGTPVLNTNISVPLFINTIGAWGNRPTARTAVPNLYIAGDYVQNEIDLACMEGAVSASLAAANALLTDLGVNAEDAPVAAVPAVWPRPLLLLARAGFFPAVVVANVTARIASFFSPSADETSTPVKKVMTRHRHHHADRRAHAHKKANSSAKDESA